ncbi:hypothetical protein [Bacillus gaemokensis]|uniref:Uncharacterized protein n=1 Tax=Bacillus gaemokensis TaxID=574375 RepID=A0A073KD77_9BACI|nr:hypothetical protein [Bacillus gaemokensis]KEK25224.1 hypothetical protein BAGA_11360 [Bacillus gaemokensis]KYG37334.1 hypothetical protein AZF08_07975 [Bacillus gaemokensis]
MISESISKKMNIISICLSVVQAILFLVLSFVDLNIKGAVFEILVTTYLLPACAILFAFLGIKHDLSKWAWMSIVMSYVFQIILGILIMSGGI